MTRVASKTRANERLKRLVDAAAFLSELETGNPDNRRRIALDYLSALRTDFEKLLHFARIIAVMSLDVAVAQELQGLRLNVEFSCRYHFIYFRLLCGIAPSEAVSNLSDMVSALTVRMETAMSELGERAALAAELASPYNGRGMDAG